MAPTVNGSHAITGRLTNPRASNGRPPHGHAPGGPSGHGPGGQSAVRRTATAEIMGTVISVTARGCSDAVFGVAVRAAFASLRHDDEVFSPFRPDSVVSRIRDGRLPRSGLGDRAHSADIREVLALCTALHVESAGGFDAWHVGDPPTFDPSGVVKGWAAARACARMTAAGLRSYALGAGGDVMVRGGDSDRPWRVGITDPHRTGCLLGVAELTEGAVATSGTAERGAHIWNAVAGEPATHLAQVTVIGPSLTWADGYATAAMSLGPLARDWLVHLALRTGYQSMTVDQHGEVWSTDDMPVTRARLLSS
jgi:thiamine biosynthesis lipoprotein